MTPFKTNKDEQFSRSNSGRKLTIMEEQNKIAYNDAEKTTANVIEISSPVDMDLTKPEGGILQDSPKSDDIREDIVKKVKFSDQHKTAAALGDLMESCVQTILNMSREEDEFHDAFDVSKAQKTKAIVEDTKNAKNTMDTNNIEDASTVKDSKNTNDNQADRRDKAEDKRRSLIQPSENFLNNSQIKIIQDNTKNMKKENRNLEASNEDSSASNQRDSNRVLMMVVMESNSGELTTDLMPLISSGLKKFQEQLLSANCQSPSNATESAKVCRRSVTTMKMSVSSESYSTNSAATNHGQLASSSSSSVQSNKNSNNGGFLSTVAQVMRHALRSFSGR